MSTWLEGARLSLAEEIQQTITKHERAGASAGVGLPEEEDKYEQVMPALKGQPAFAHLPENNLSLFLARRTKTIHFIRHGEGTHNAAIQAYGDTTPVTATSDYSFQYKDAPLTNKGIRQALELRENNYIDRIKPDLVVVSPFTRSLQTAHLLFSSQHIPFVVHELCGEKSGKYTCDKRRTRDEIVGTFTPLFDATQDIIDFDSHGFNSNDDEAWTEERESEASCTKRAIELLLFLATLPEKEIAVVTHATFLRTLFKSFTAFLDVKDQKVIGRIGRKTGQCEMRSLTLAPHRGFYPVGEWKGEFFTPRDKSFRRGKWAPNVDTLSRVHSEIRSNM